MSAPRLFSLFITLFVLSGCAGGDDPYATQVNQNTANGTTDADADSDGNTTDADADADADSDGNTTDADADADSDSDGNTTDADADADSDGNTTDADADNDGNTTDADADSDSDGNTTDADADADAVSDGNTTDADADNDGNTTDADADADAESCQSTQDCLESEVCALVTGSNQLVTRCVEDNDQLLTGEPCTTHSECASLYCMDGTCSAPCTPETLCGYLQVCDAHQASKDGFSTTFNLCTPLDSCLASIDCSPGEACNTFIELDESLVPLCSPADPDGIALGTTCTSNQSCESQFCWPSTDQTIGTCSAFCELSDRDCAPNQVCAEVAPDYGVCLEACTRKDDCSGGDICYLDLDSNANAIHGYCISPIGDLDTGEDCTATADCQSGLCLTRSRYQIGATCINDANCDDAFLCQCPPDNPACSNSERRCIHTTEESKCSTACNNANGDADCSGDHGMTVCNDEIRLNWDTGSELVSACSLP